MSLREFRESLGLSQADLAAAVGVTSKAYISQMESGTLPVPVHVALKLERWSEGRIRAVDLLDGEKADLLREAIARGLPAPEPQPVEA